MIKPHLSKIKVDVKMSLGMDIPKKKDADPDSDKESWLRQLIGQDRRTSRLKLIQRGIALSLLVDRFISLWSEKIGVTVHRPPVLH